MIIRIFDRKWNVRVLSNERFTKEYGNDAAGVTITAYREIAINEDDLSLEVVIHELFHAYSASLCISSANLETSQVEEVHADLMACYHGNILTHAKTIMNKLGHKST